MLPSAFLYTNKRISDIILKAVWFCLVYNISTFEGYWMSNLFLYV